MSLRSLFYHIVKQQHLFFRCITAQERIKLFICIQCEFCIELTSFSQETVEKSLIFIDILNESVRHTFEKFAIFYLPEIDTKYY